MCENSKNIAATLVRIKKEIELKDNRFNALKILNELQEEKFSIEVSYSIYLKSFLKFKI